MPERRRLAQTAHLGPKSGKGDCIWDTTGTVSLNSPGTNWNQPHSQLAHELSYPKVCKGIHSPVPAWVRIDISAIRFYLIKPSQHHHPKRAQSPRINLDTALLSSDISELCREMQERS